MDQQSAINEIALIRQVIDESRRFAFDNGKYYILWGVLVTLAIFAQYAVILMNIEYVSVWIWIVAIGLGWIVSLIFGMREPSRHQSFPVGAKLVSLIWTSTGISMMIVGIVGPITGALHPWAICPAMAAIIGGAFTTSSMVYRLKWVAAVGIAWWAGAIVMFAVKGIETLPIYGVMMILFQVVPGLVFYRNSKRNPENAGSAT